MLFNYIKHVAASNKYTDDLLSDVKVNNHSCDIQYRPGKYNQATDCLTSSLCSALLTQKLSNNESINSICSYKSDNKVKLEELHNALCHPGMSRMNHFVRNRNLPYSIEEIECRKPAHYLLQLCANSNERAWSNTGVSVSVLFSSSLWRYLLEFKPVINASLIDS